MPLYIFDTDHLSLHQRNPDLFQARLAAISHEIAITVITAEEQLRGRFLQIGKAKSTLALTDAYRRLRTGIESLNEYRILDYDYEADVMFTTLRKQKIRISTSDLRIAAIALTTKSILLSRNAIDFDQVAELIRHDWTT